MSKEHELERLLTNLAPEQRPGAYVFSTVDGPAAIPDVELAATVAEPEGLSLVTTRHDADRAGLAYDYVAGWITLRVPSALDAVGLTAVVSRALANRQISCNMIAGHHHDHLLVPLDQVTEALAVLRSLQNR